MELEQIKELMRCMEEGKLSKLIFKKGDMEIRLEKETERKYLIPRESTFPSELPLQGEVGGSTSRTENHPSTERFVTSPMVGTFYASSAPDQPPFVKIGDKVDEQSVVCIIEAMKVMNEVKAGVSGTIVAVLAENAQPVEFGTSLFRIQ